MKQRNSNQTIVNSKFSKVVKSVFILILLAIAFTKSQAQIKLGAEAGYNIANFIDKSNNQYISTSSISTLQIGAKADMYLSKKIIFQTGLSAFEKGGFRGTTNFALSGSTTTTKLWYLQVPANLKYQFNVGKKGVQLFAGAGLYLAAGISGTEKGYTQSTTGTITPVDNTISFTNNNSNSTNSTAVKPIDFGYNMFVGAEWKNFQLQAGYSKGNSKVFTAGTTNMVNSVFSFTLAYMWRVKK